MITDTLIIGGGLSGLALADKLERDNQDYQLVEARPRFGGRIKTETTDSGAYDVGPAWFWPGQPRIAELIERFSLTAFEQHYEGNLLFEDEHQGVRQGPAYASMQGSWRLDGGMQKLVDSLVDTLPAERVKCGVAVTGVRQVTSGVVVSLADGSELIGRRVVFALPLRLLAVSIAFDPPLPQPVASSLSGVATWMAGHAKAVAVYEKPFWRERGLSGDATSRRGPMVEIHDASPRSGEQGALFGFIGVPAASRQNEELLREAVVDQLVRLFGSDAAKPSNLFIKDWAFDPRTATREDQKPLYAHPAYGLARSARTQWDGRIVFSGTEAAPEFGGFLEGALEAAALAAETIREQISTGSDLLIS